MRGAALPRFVRGDRRRRGGAHFSRVDRGGREVPRRWLRAESRGPDGPGYLCRVEGPGRRVDRRGRQGRCEDSGRWARGPDPWIRERQLHKTHNPRRREPAGADRKNRDLRAGAKPDPGQGRRRGNRRRESIELRQSSLPVHAQWGGGAEVSVRSAGWKHRNQRWSSSPDCLLCLQRLEGQFLRRSPWAGPRCGRVLHGKESGRGTLAKGLVAGLLALFAILVLTLKSLIQFRNRTCPSPIRSRDRLVTTSSRSKLRDVDPRVERGLPRREREQI